MGSNPQSSSSLGFPCARSLPKRKHTSIPKSPFSLQSCTRLALFTLGGSVSIKLDEKPASAAGFMPPFPRAPCYSCWFPVRLEKGKLEMLAVPLLLTHHLSSVMAPLCPGATSELSYFRANSEYVCACGWVATKQGNDLIWF